MIKTKTIKYRVSNTKTVVPTGSVSVKNSLPPPTFKSTKDKTYDNLNVTTTAKVPVKQYVSNNRPGRPGEIVLNNVNNKFYGYTPNGWVALSGGGGGGGGIIQYTTVSTTLALTLGNSDATTLIACNNHVPTIGEGKELLNITFIPNSGTSRIIIEADCIIAMQGQCIVCIALFDNSLTDTLIVSPVSDGFGTWVVPVYYEMDSWGTTSKTFSIRCGVDTAPPTGAVPSFSIFTNRVQEIGGLNYGGKLNSSISITELLL